MTSNGGGHNFESDTTAGGLETLNETRQQRGRLGILPSLLIQKEFLTIYTRI